MSIRANGDELLQAARCEDLVYEQIADLSVLGEYERRLVDTLKQAGSHLLQGARGVGKSMLLRQAEIEMDADFQEKKILAVYVNFKTSTLLEGVRANHRDAFQIWVGIKILQALHEKLLALDIIGTVGVSDPYERIFAISSSEKITTFLQEKHHLLQQLAMAPEENDEVIQKLNPAFIERVNDTSFLLSAIKEIIEQFKLQKIVFLFDEAAHTFIPSQQEIFFEIFKLLHGGRIAVKAAVYPTVTSYGRNFEIGQDAIVLNMDRFEPGRHSLDLNRNLFRDMLLKRIQLGTTRKKILSRGHLLDLCIDLSTGNPRAFLHLFNRTWEKGWSDRAVLLATQEFVDQELLPYHLRLAKRLPKYAHHVRVGLDLMRTYIIAEIQKKNNREKKRPYQSAFFTFQRDMSPNLKLALDILCYSGVLTSKGTVKIAGQQTGPRYMVHLALLANEKAFSTPRLDEAIRALSLTDYREFASNDPEFESYLNQLKESTDKCSECSSDITPNARFCSECGARIEVRGIIGKLLDDSIDELSISDKLKARLKPQYMRIGQIVQAERTDLMQIPYIKDVRSRFIKNAAEEFISG